MFKAPRLMRYAYQPAKGTGGSQDAAGHQIYQRHQIRAVRRPPNGFTQVVINDGAEILLIVPSCCRRSAKAPRSRIVRVRSAYGLRWKPDARTVQLFLRGQRDRKRTGKAEGARAPSAAASVMSPDHRPGFCAPQNNQLTSGHQITLFNRWSSTSFFAKLR